MRGGGGYGGGFSGMMGQMRGLEAGGIRAPTMDNLSDEGTAGRAYDHRVVMRLLTYLGHHKSDVVTSVGAVMVYAAGNVAIPLMLLFAIDAFY